MNLRRPASGRRIGTGVLRVDARRAIAKLREYQLSDPSDWILEGIRAAVLSGATQIDLQGDSNDIWLSWHGVPWDRENIVELLNELVSPASAQKPQLRLLATAVNSALGLDPAYIDVYRIEGSKAEKVRYTPEVLEAPEDPEQTSILDSLSLEQAATPTKADGAAMFIHLRRRFGMEHVRNFFRGEPPELATAREACVDISVPITIGKALFGTHCNANDLLRIPLKNDLTGFLALTQERQAEGNKTQIHVAECGVRIVHFDADIGGPLRAPLPLRLVIDADRMPTNASRSKVRRNAHPISAAIEQLPDLFLALCEELASLLSSDEESGELLRAAALKILAAAVAGDGWSTRILSADKPYRKLARLPLLRNALGEPRSLVDLWSERSVYSDRMPLSQDLGKWFRTTIWVPKGDPAHRLLGDFDPRSFKFRLRHARRSLKAQRRFLAHKRRPPKFQEYPEHWVRAAISAPIAGTCAPPAELEGELCLVSGSGGVMTILLDGREIEEVEVESDIGFRAIVSTKKLDPASDFRSVERNLLYDAMEAEVRRACIRCVEAICIDGTDSYQLSVATSSMELRTLARSALTDTRALKIRAGESPLTKVDAWPKVRGGWISLQELRRLPFVGTAATAHDFSLPPIHTGIVCLNFATRAFLLEDLEPDTVVVHYDWLKNTTVNHAQTLVNASSGTAALRIDDRNERGAIAWGASHRRLRIYHWGKQLLLPPGSSWDGPHVHIDSDHVVPTHDWNFLRDAAGLLHRDFAAWERRLAIAFALAVLGRPPDNFRTSGMSYSDPSGRCFIRALVDAEDPAEILGERLFHQLAALRQFPVLGHGHASAIELAERYPITIEYLEDGPMRSIPSSGDWHPMVTSNFVATLAACLARRELREVSAELAMRLAEAGRARRLQEHRAQTPVSANGMLSRCSVVLSFENDLFKGIIGITDTLPKLDLQVLVEERPFHATELKSSVPLMAAVTIEPSQADLHFRSVPKKLMGKIAGSLRMRASALVKEALRIDPTALVRSVAIRNFCKIWIGQNSLSKIKVEKIIGAVRFLDQYGSPIALSEAVEGETVAIARDVGMPWLGPPEGEAKASLDAPILTIPELGSAEIESILQLLCGDLLIDDKSDQVRQLQTERRIQRGQLITPRVPGDGAFKRRLTQLSANDGLGEIGFHEAVNAEVRLWQGTMEQTRLQLNLGLPVVVAFDDAALYESAVGGGLSGLKQQFLTERVSELAILLLRSVLESGVEIPEWLRGGLAAALCVGAFEAQQVEGLVELPLFRTTNGSRCSWQDLQAQAKRFGSVWFTDLDCQLEALDPARLVVAMRQAEIPSLFTPALNFIDAHNELALDQLARQNQTRQLSSSLALDEHQVKAVIATTGLKVKRGPKGIVAPLQPQFASMRGVNAHCKMRPFGKGKDPCSWPTLAIVDDPSLKPNRTWSAPQDDKHWKELCAKIVKASDQALSSEHPIPKSAVTSHWVGRYVEALEPAYFNNGVVLRGRLWLTDSTAPGQVEIATGVCDRSFGARFDRAGRNLLLPVHGRLWCYAPPEANLVDVVDEVVSALYPRLLRQLAALKRASPALKAAHLAIGIATHNVKPQTIGKSEFSCFAPTPLRADGLLKFLGGQALDTSFVDDGSELSRAVLRLQDGARVVGRVFTPIPIDVLESPASSLTEEVYAQLKRLKLGKIIATVALELGTRTPIVRVEGNRLVLAGDNDDLKQLQAEKIAGSIYYQEALRLLICHVLTVLNQGLTEVTDAAERRALLSLLRSA